MGLKSGGRSLDGWYGRGVYHIFGQILGGLSRLYTSLGDCRLKDRAIQLFEGWKACIEEDGYCLYNRRNEVLDPHYEYEKLLGGLLDIYIHLEVPEALEYAEIITRWAFDNLDREPAVNGAINNDSREWHTLSENLYRAYLYTKNEIFMEFASVWEYDSYWNKYIVQDEDSIPPVHAYSHLNTLCGAARAYQVKLEDRYLEIIKNAYTVITGSHIFSTGGFGPAERLFEGNGYLIKSIMERPGKGYGNVEVSCCSYAVLKFCSYLIRYTEDALYGDWVEKVIYNLIGAQPKPDPGGKIMYYADYNIMGGVKLNNDGRMNDDGLTYEWPCCMGTYIQAIADYSRSCIFTNNKGIYISQFIPFDGAGKAGKIGFNIGIRTNYPFEERVDIDIECEGPLSVNIRKPSWADGVRIEVNGKKQTYAIDRGWIDVSLDSGYSRIVIQIDMPIRIEELIGTEGSIVSFCKGPLVLVGDKRAGIKKSCLRRGIMDNRDGTWTVQKGSVVLYDDKTVTLRPISSIPPGEAYYLYYFLFD